MSEQIKKQIDRLEQEIVAKNKELAKLRASVPRRKIKDYTLKGPGGSEVNLSQLFSKEKYLVLIHNMGQACKYCTMWANGFEGIYKHFEGKAGFVLVSPDEPEKQKKFAEQNGWTFKMYSALDSSFSYDLGFATDDNKPLPGVSTFRKKEDGTIELLTQAKFGEGDNYCTVWHLYDLLPEEYEY